MYVGLLHLYGSWLMLVYGLTQHTGLAENVLDHRLNCRTVQMNPLNRFLYWNMNYHVEHHMFPLVPYHALPKLHQLVKRDMPEPYPGLLAAWREIIPTALRQRLDPSYHVRRKLPAPLAARAFAPPPVASAQTDDGWIKVCAAIDLRPADALRFDHGRKTYALYRDATGSLFATDGICTHGNTHLADGLVIGGAIECPKHNGRFNLADGSPARPPVCRGLLTYPIEERSALDPPQCAGSTRRWSPHPGETPPAGRFQPQCRHFYQGTGAGTCESPIHHSVRAGQLPSVRYSGLRSDLLSRV